MFHSDQAITIEINGQEVEVDAEVQYQVIGKYIPGTLTDPPCYPDIEINKITAFFWGKSHDVNFHDPNILPSSQLASIQDTCYSDWEDNQEGPEDDGREDD